MRPSSVVTALAILMVVATGAWGADVLGDRPTVREDPSGRHEIVNLHCWPSRADVRVTVRTAANVTTCIEKAGRSLCPWKRKNYGGLKSFKLPQHCTDETECSFAMVPIPSGDFAVAIYDYQAKQPGVAVWRTGDARLTEIDRCTVSAGGSPRCLRGSKVELISRGPDTTCGESPSASRLNLTFYMDGPGDRRSDWAVWALEREAIFVKSPDDLADEALRRLKASPGATIGDLRIIAHGGVRSDGSGYFNVFCGAKTCNSLHAGNVGLFGSAMRPLLQYLTRDSQILLLGCEVGRSPGFLKSLSAELSAPGRGVRVTGYTLSQHPLAFETGPRVTCTPTGCVR